MKLHSTTTVLFAQLLIENGKASSTTENKTKRLRKRSVYKSEAGSAHRGSSIAEEAEGEDDQRKLQDDVAWFGSYSIPIAEVSGINIDWPSAPGPVLVKPIVAQTEESPPPVPPAVLPISVEVEGQGGGGLFAETPTDEGPPLPPPIALPAVTTTIDLDQWAIQTNEPLWFNRSSGWVGTSFDEAVEFCSSDATPEGYGLCTYAAVCPEGDEGPPFGGLSKEGGESWVPVVGNLPTTVSSSNPEMSLSITANNPDANKEESEYWVQASSTSSGGLFSDAETCTLHKQLDLDVLQNGGNVDDMELIQMTRHVACCFTPGEAAHSSIFMPELGLGPVLVNEPSPAIDPEQEQISTSQVAVAPGKMHSCPDTLDAMEVLDEDATLYYAIVPSFPPAANNGLLCARLEVADEGWVGLAVSTDGYMIGSEAVIGLPDDGSVKKYNLASKNGVNVLEVLEEMEESKQTLEDAYITQEDGMTKMGFIKKLVEPNEIPILENGENIFLHARGWSNTPGYHKTRFMFTKDFEIPFPLEPGRPVIIEPVASDEEYDPFLGMGSMSLPEGEEDATDAESPAVCSVCPDGLTVPDDTFVPFLDDGGVTCGEVEELASTYAEGDELCDDVKMSDFLCCPTVPDVPCEYCSSTGGITVDGSLVIIQDEGTTCDMAVLFAAVMEEGSEDCAIVKDTESDCCPTEEPSSPCQFCTDGMTVPDDTPIPSLNGGAMTCGEANDLANTVAEDDELCKAEIVCCPPVAAVPCKYCAATNGITVEGSTLIPDSDGETCDNAVTLAKSFEDESEQCADIQGTEPDCCPTVDSPAPAVVAEPCEFCPDGLTVPDDTSVPFLNDGDMTCSEAANLATTFSNDGNCYRLLEAADFVCCPPVPEVPCNYCVGVSTVDDSVIIPDSDGNTCGAAALFAPVVEGTSEECATILSSEATCCPDSLPLPEDVEDGVDVEMSMSMPMQTVPTASPIKIGDDSTTATPATVSSSSPSDSPTRGATSRPTMSPIIVVKVGAKPSSATVMGTSFFCFLVMIAGLLHF